MNAFHVAGILLAAWAVVLTALGIKRREFPGKGGERVVVVLSTLLVAAAIASGILSSAIEDAEKHEMEKQRTEHAGGEAPAPLPGGARKLELSAHPGGELKFDRDRLEVPAGRTTIVMTNPAPLPHNLVLEGNGVEQEGITVGTRGTSTVTADLRPGEYTFYCSVLGHHEGGMEGTLTVR